MAPEIKKINPKIQAWAQWIIWFILLAAAFKILFGWSVLGW